MAHRFNYNQCKKYAKHYFNKDSIKTNFKRQLRNSFRKLTETVDNIVLHFMKTFQPISSCLVIFV